MLDSLFSFPENRAAALINFKFEKLTEFGTNLNVQYTLRKLLSHQNNVNIEIKTKLFGPISLHLTTRNDKFTATPFK